MKILVLGGNGMIGHQLYKSWNYKHVVKVTIRSSFDKYKSKNIFRERDIFDNIDVKNKDKFEDVVYNFTPDVIINSIGITKKLANINNSETNLINSKFPHYLSKLCQKYNVRLIQLSSDCVFSGKKGDYKIDDFKDAEDTYGVSKSKGELLNQKNVLTIRKSTIGFELDSKHGLLEWFLSQSGDVQGYTNAIFNGMTTIELAKKLIHIIENQKELSGICHLTGEKIDKFTLLNKIKKVFKINKVNVTPYPDYRCDRSLKGAGITKDFKYEIPSWDDMLEELYNSSKKQ